MLSSWSVFEMPRNPLARIDFKRKSGVHGRIKPQLRLKELNSDEEIMRSNARWIQNVPYSERRRCNCFWIRRSEKTYLARTTSLAAGVPDSKRPNTSNS